jgi:CheY-like chemotaxis protein
MRILIVDDSPGITDLLLKVLTTIGHDVVTADNGRDGLTLMMEQRFDAILLDIAMPDFSGLDVIDKLVENKTIKDYLIVLFTASSISDAEVNKLVQKGVHSCLRKPVRIETLFEKIEEISKVRKIAGNIRKNE